MAVASLKITKAGADRYKLEFKAERGRIVCEVSPSHYGRAGSEADSREAALRSAKMLARAFHESILER